MSTSAVPGEGSPIQVVAAVIRRGGRLLVGRRSGGKRHAGRWEFPGGKVLDGESVQDAVARELKEELDLELESVEPEVFSFPDPGTDFRIYFHPARASGTPRSIEHQELRWCDRAELSALDLAPADAAFVRFYVAKFP